MGNLTFKHKPLDTPLTVTSEYGLRELSGSKNLHAGIDFAITYNDLQKSTVYAVESGTVLAVKEGSNMHADYGNTVIIQHPNNQLTLYAHLDSLAHNISPGQTVTAGSPLGKAGQTGKAATGPHLHLEIIDGNYQITDINGKTLTALQLIDNAKLRPNIGISSGIARLNPRPYLSTAFPADFPRTVNAGINGIDLEGDSRGNTFTGNSKPNIYTGKSGADTYTFPDPSKIGIDKIIDSNKNGVLKLEGISIQQATISCTKNPTTNQTATDQWQMIHNSKKYHLARADQYGHQDEAGTDLYIISQATPDNSIRIKDFDFVNGAFGITLPTTQAQEAAPEQKLTSTTNYQKEQSSLIPTQGGGYIAKWSKQFDTVFGIYNNKNTRIGSEVTIKKSPIKLIQLSNGNIISLHADYEKLQDGSATNNHGVYIQKYDNTGNKLESETFSKTGTGCCPSLEYAMSDGNNFFTIENKDINNISSLILNKYDNNGIQQGTSKTLETGSLTNPQLIKLSDGKYHLSYMQNGNIYSQKYTTNLTKEGQKQQISNNFKFGPFSQTPLKTGGYVISWGTDSGVSAYMVDSLGNIKQFQVATAIAPTQGSLQQLYQSVSTLKDGGFVVSWEGEPSIPTNGLSDVYAKIYNQDGSERTAEFRINKEQIRKGQYNPSVLGLEDGNFVTSFMSENPATNQKDLYIRSFNANGKSASQAQCVLSGENIALPQNSGVLGVQQLQTNKISYSSETNDTFKLPSKNPGKYEIVGFRNGGDDKLDLSLITNSRVKRDLSPSGIVTQEGTNTKISFDSLGIEIILADYNKNNLKQEYIIGSVDLGLPQITTTTKPTTSSVGTTKPVTDTPILKTTTKLSLPSTYTTRPKTSSISQTPFINSTVARSNSTTPAISNDAAGNNNWITPVSVAGGGALLAGLFGGVLYKLYKRHTRVSDNSAIELTENIQPEERNLDVERGASAVETSFRTDFTAEKETTWVEKFNALATGSKNDPMNPHYGSKASTNNNDIAL